ncbi:hypothetical protein TRFO_30565 [Tritrichomonas foetus]|uniref:Uncharacterized protein n=1 Tax=Tritrichomonas foetus TaxID=1144522 RepID=A0A1J4JUI3_9EUKA|nr:hypothetical protein TRFO_30565 [Tritrichomonas foetus]|eukprot:OHT02370.1 hypothetical protein TRFO_30565 [Tritrichomonas foetus]
MRRNPNFRVKSVKSVLQYCDMIGIKPLAMIYCKTQSVKMKMRKHILVLSQSKIYVLSLKKIETIERIRKSFSILDLEKIVKEKDIYTFYFSHISPLIATSKDMKGLVKILLIFFGQYYRHYPVHKEIKCEGFEDYFEKELSICENTPPHILVIRYDTIVDIFNLTPLPDFERHLIGFEETNRTYIRLGYFANPVFNYKILTFPMICETPLSIVRFDSIAPQLICKVIHMLVKHLKSLSTIILENYSNLQYELLCLETIPNPSVVSWHFIRIFYSEQCRNRLSGFLKCFEKYHGSIQNFHLEDVFCNKSTSNSLVNCLKAKCFSTLEFLILRDLKLGKKSSEKDASECFEKICYDIPSLNTLHTFEFKSNVIYKPVGGTGQIIPNNSVRSIIFDGFDLCDLTDPIKFPEFIKDIQFNHCRFHYKSLSNIIRSLSEINGRFCLSMTDLIIDFVEKIIFEEHMHKLPILKNLIELDWSGNQISDEFLPTFLKVFCHAGLKILSINRIFSSKNTSILKKIMNHLSTINIWGLDLSGSRFCKLGDELVDIMDDIGKINTLEHLDISHQCFSDITTISILKTMSDKLKILNELSMDGTQISVKSGLLNVYNHLIHNKIKALQRPVSDMKRLFEKNDINNEKVLRFQQKMQRTKIPSDRHSRVCFYEFSYDLSAKFIGFYSNYPAPSIIDWPDTPYWLTVIDIQCSYPRSVYDQRSEKHHMGFSEHQIKALTTPFEDPYYSVSENDQFKIPKKLLSYKMYVPKASYSNEAISTTVITRGKQILKEYPNLMNKKTAKILGSIGKIKSIFSVNVSEEAPIEDIERPPEFVSEDAISIFQKKCSLLFNVHYNQSETSILASSPCSESDFESTSFINTSHGDEDFNDNFQELKRNRKYDLKIQPSDFDPFDDVSSISYESEHMKNGVHSSSPSEEQNDSQTTSSISFHARKIHRLSRRAISNAQLPTDIMPIIIVPPKTPLSAKSDDCEINIPQVAHSTPCNRSIGLNLNPMYNTSQESNESSYQNHQTSSDNFDNTINLHPQPSYMVV